MSEAEGKTELRDPRVGGLAAGWDPVLRHRRCSTVRKGSYTVRLVEGLLDGDEGQLAERLDGRRALVVTTPTVAKLYGGALSAQLRRFNVDAAIIVSHTREAEKSANRVLDVCREAQRIHLDRKGVIVGFGGGVCLDIAKVAASWIRRGVTFFAVPTTLIGQCDAGIGAKGAINFRNQKSALGCFHPPQEVLVSPDLLRTLPRRFLQDGFAELIKIALVCNGALFEMVEASIGELIDTGFARPRETGREILWQAIVEMLAQLEPNLFEDQTYERLVDFGHTFSPVIESESSFSITHGQAVAIDMALSCGIAAELGHLRGEDRQRVEDAIRSAQLPLCAELVTVDLCLRAIHSARQHRGGHVNLVVPIGVGSATYLKRNQDIPRAAIESVLERLRQGESSRVVRRQAAQASGPPGCRCMVFDIGGSHVRGALYDQETRSLLRAARQPAPNFLSHPADSVGELRTRLIDDLRSMSTVLNDGAAPEVVALAFPGPVDPRGNVHAAPTLWGTRQNGPVSLTDDLRRVWPSARLLVLNDVSAAGYRYLRHATDDLCIITVGSGIGQKVFIQGAPIVGDLGLGGEIGHLRVDYAQDAPVCDCGGAGHLGAIASGRGSVLMARRRAGRDPEAFARSMVCGLAGGDPQAIGTGHIVAAFSSGDSWARDLVREIAEPLGRVLGAIHISTGIQRFIVYGGFALALGDEYRRELALAAGRSTWGHVAAWGSMIELGFPDDDSGLIGAGRYATEFGA